MASLKQFECKHCKTHTVNYCETQIRFRQLQYEQSFGRLYGKDSKQIDHGLMPVFLCDKCVKDYVKKTYIRVSRLRVILRIFPLAFLLLAVFVGNYEPDIIKSDKVMIVMTMAVFFIQIYFDNLWNNELIEQRIRHYPKSGVSVGVDQGSARAMYGVASSTGYPLILGVGTVAVIIATIFMPVTAFPVYVEILTCIVATMFLNSLFGLINGFSMLGKNHTRVAAIKYYFSIDDGIDLED